MSDSPIALSFDLDSVENEQSGVRRRERVKEGISSYRILPPYGTNHSNALSHKYFVHWGFIGANGKERSVTCSYPSEGYCPICTRVREAEDEMKRAEALGDKVNAEKLKEYISKFRVKKFWLYNAVTSDGRIVMLDLGKTAHDGLAKRILEAVRRKVGAYDPTSPETGVWFEFTRTGKGLNTEYAVDFKKTSVTLDDGSVAEKPDRTPLSADLVKSIKAALASQAEGVLHDIHTQHDATTSAELRALMNGGVVGKKETAPAEKPAVNAGNVQAEIDRLKTLQATA